MRRPSSSVVAIGFSTSTCLPAAIASSAMLACCAEGAVMQIASMSLRETRSRWDSKCAIGRRPMRS
jgi:hypothetical protein